MDKEPGIFYPTSKEKWIIDRLKRRGFKLYNQNDTHVWYYMSLTGISDFSVTGGLIVQISRNDCGVRKLSYRLRFHSDIHLHRYMYLHKKDWSRLDHFIKLCKDIEDRYGSSKSW